jgi:alanyl-tRNA synthetase
MSNPLTGHQIRDAFLSYFQQELGHKRLPSASLVPVNNPTVLLTPAGMLPFVPIFLGLEPRPNPPRATSSQKCARVSGKASDLEAVGRTPRHHTFFEMLGNFSFGDYFKADIIPWSWTFLTERLGLPADRLWVSVFRDDEEAYSLWREKVGVPEARLFRCDETDNFWGPPGPTGPCGPCTEIHYDLTQNPNDPLDVRLMELWNLVFMEFFKDGEGNFSPLEHKNVDTGMGLERITTVIQNKPNTFETDLLWPLVQATSEQSGKRYGASSEIDVALKIVADHSRFLGFALSDGVIPSNEGRGYILRMILRRAVRYGRQRLALEKPFLSELLPVLAHEYGAAYPELKEHLSKAQTIVEREEVRFLETLDKGTLLLRDQMEGLKTKGEKVLAGSDVFRLYDTYGLPMEVSKDLLEEEGLSLDEEGYEVAREEARQLARQGKKSTKLVENTVFADILADVGPTRFVGYDVLESLVTVKALVVEGEPVDAVSGTNQPFQLVLDQTPFYAESGGQIGDKGQLMQLDVGEQGITVLITDTQKFGDLIVHQALFDQGEALTVGQALTALVDSETRRGTRQHHSATHLLHSALRKVLGSEATQAGSWVGPTSARFDFSFPRGVTASELNQIEAWANRWIEQDYQTVVAQKSLDEAKAGGALAMFNEKYGDTVRVVQFGEASQELCGGTHVPRTGEIRLIRILSEQAVASGVRRIEFVVGTEAYRSFKQDEAVLKTLAQSFKSPVAELPQRIEQLQTQVRQLEKQLETAQTQAALSQLATLESQAKASESVLFTAQVMAPSGDALKELATRLQDKLGESKALLLAATETDPPKVQFVATVPPSLIAKGLKAGDLVKAAATLCEGNGGGKPQLAQAGGKNPEALPSAFEAALALAKTHQG